MEGDTKMNQRDYEGNNYVLDHLEWLIPQEEIVIRREKEQTAWLSRAWDSPKRYIITDANRQYEFTCDEESESYARAVLGNTRPFTMAVKDPNMTEVLRFDKPFRHLSQRITVQVGEYILGTVKEKFKCCGALLNVYDSDNRKVLKIKADCCLCICCVCCSCNTNFKIQLAGTSRTIGWITKEYSGCALECKSNGNLLTLSFPPTLDVGCKALLIGSTILMDYIYWISKIRHRS